MNRGGRAEDGGRRTEVGGRRRDGGRGTRGCHRRSRRGAASGTFRRRASERGGVRRAMREGHSSGAPGQARG